MKSWKKRWKEELDATVPELRDYIKDAPIPATADNFVNNGANTAVKARINKTVPIATLIAVLLCTLIACMIVLFPKQAEIFLFEIEINPAISMATDGKGNVTGVIASNPDADVILSTEGVKDNILNRNIAAAAAYYADCAAKLGYIDLSVGGSVVRISGCSNGKGEDLLSNAKSALEDYFARKGVFVAVLSETVSVEEFGNRSGIDKSALKDIARFIAENDTLYSDRQAQGMSLQELQSLYGSAVVENKLFDTVKDTIFDNLEKLQKNASDIQNLIEIYTQIYSHDDNPAALLKDYWEVKKYYGNELSGDFALIMQSMEDALAKYKQDYGVEISSIFELKDAAESYLSVSVESMEKLLEDFTNQTLLDYGSAICEIMRAAGLATEDITSIMSLPETVDEYYEKTVALVRKEYEYRLGEYKNTYEEIREPISREEYDRHIEEIIMEYGSLNEYWQSLKG